MWYVKKSPTVFDFLHTTEISVVTVVLSVLSPKPNLEHTMINDTLKTNIKTALRRFT